MKNNKNNKGFSLVELIVVVLIMAIIAVALAPQVMKWVGNSRVAADKQTADAVVSACELAMTNADAYSAVHSGSGDVYKITIDKTNGFQFTVPSGVTTSDKFVISFCKNMGFDTKVSGKDIALKSDKTVTVTVNANGLVSSDAETVFASDFEE